MTMGRSNNALFVLLAVVLLGAGGFLWYSRMYQPAIAERDAAVGSEQQARADMTAAQQRLKEVQAQLEEATKESAADVSLGLLQKARTAVPDRKLIDDATIELESFADRAGIETNFKLGESGDSSDSGSSGAAADPSSTIEGAQGISIPFEAVGTWAEMLQFMDYVQSTVWADRGKLYTRGRLYNVVGLTIGAPEQEEETDSLGMGDFGTSTTSEASTLVPDTSKGEYLFTVTIRMYTSSVENNQSVGAENGTEDDVQDDGADGAAATGDGTGGGGEQGVGDAQDETGTGEKSGASVSASGDDPGGGAT